MCIPPDHGNGQGKYKFTVPAGKWAKGVISYTHGPDPAKRLRVYKVTILKASSPDLQVKWRRFGPGDALVSKGAFSNTLDFVLNPKDKYVVIDLFCKEQVEILAKRVPLA